MNQPVILIGGGGHAKVLIEALRKQNFQILGFVDPAFSKNQAFSGVFCIGNDEDIKSHAPETVLLVNAVGSVNVTDVRRRIFEKFKAQGYTFANVIHPSAVIAADVHIGEGVQVMAGTVLQPGTVIGNNTILNTRSSIDHDCKIGNHVHVAPGVTLSGNVVIGDGCHIGTGASVIQGITIEENCLVAAGTAIYKNILKKSTHQTIGFGS
jgi:UDP-perosamine 4-acetyltransferase